MIDWSFVLAIVFTGLVVVFLALIILIVFLSIMGAIIKFAEKMKNKGKDTSTIEENSHEVTETDVLTSSDTSQINDEVIAVITAAVAYIMTKEGNKKPFVIKSVKKSSNNTRSAWSMAGINENVQPF